MRYQLARDIVGKLVNMRPLTACLADIFQLSNESGVLCLPRWVVRCERWGVRGGQVALRPLTNSALLLLTMLCEEENGSILGPVELRWWERVALGRAGEVGEVGESKGEVGARAGDPAPPKPRLDGLWRGSDPDLVSSPTLVDCLNCTRGGRGEFSKLRDPLSGTFMCRVFCDSCFFLSRDTLFFEQLGELASMAGVHWLY